MTLVLQHSPTIWIINYAHQAFILFLENTTTKNPLWQSCVHKLSSDRCPQTTWTYIYIALSKLAATDRNNNTHHCVYSPGHCHLWWPGQGERTHCRWGWGWLCASAATVSPCRRSGDKPNRSERSQLCRTTCSLRTVIEILISNDFSYHSCC